MKHYFLGGIHLENGMDKLLSREKKIKEYIAQKVKISMEQGQQNPSRLIVEEGDHVREGQVIGLPWGEFSSNIHASISGLVTEIEKYKNKKGEMVSICCIEADLNEEKPVRSSPKWEYTLTAEMVIKKMKQSGLIGMGGSGFPTHMKYEGKANITTLLINGIECRPYITCDDRLMVEMGEKVLQGIKYLLLAARCNRGILCIGENKPEAIYQMRELISKDWREEAKLEVLTLPVKYPQGGEYQLIYSVLHKEVPKGKNPTDISIAVNNVATAAALADIIDRDIPVIKRIVTITGDIENPGNFLVPVGTLYSDLISMAGGAKMEDNKVVAGDPMTGMCIGSFQNEYNIHGSVKKTTSGIIIIKDFVEDESNCIRCGACGNICPSGLAPYEIDAAYLKENIGVCDHLQASQCIGCGSCSYVCPAKRNLAYRVVAAKNIIIDKETSKGGR